MKKVTSCRCCGKSNLLRYLNLGKQPPANSYHKKNEILPIYPLEVMLCKNCFHSQLSIVVDPELMFENYLYVSGTTETFRKHCEDLAVDAVKRFSRKKLSVLDIACNDGTQLEFFRSLNCEILGVDPAKNLRKITLEKNIPVIVDYWSKALAKKIRKKFDIITGTNVFAHVDNIMDFLLACKEVLNENGYIILEFPYCDKMIKNNEFDTVYHEHLSYFLVNSFFTLIDKAGLTITDIIQTPIHGGSIRFFLSSKRSKASDKTKKLIDLEKKSGLLNLITYQKFTERVNLNKKTFKNKLKELKKTGKRIVGYGASAKGNTMLNYFKANLEYIVDDNPLKWDYLTPGRDILIVSPERFSKDPVNLAIVILSWNFYAEIKKKIKKLRPKTKADLCILYVPTVSVNKLN